MIQLILVLNFFTGLIILKQIAATVKSNILIH